MKRLMLTCMVLFSLLVPASIAQAGMIENWGYSTNAIFTGMKWGTSPSTPGIASGVGGSFKTIQYDGKTVGGYSKYHWGDSVYSASSVDVWGTNGTLTVNGDKQAGIIVNHINKPIYTKSLVQGTILTQINLSGDDGKANFTVNSALDFHFLETPNVGNYQDDIFFMTQAEILKSVGSFTYEGIEYNVSIHSNVKQLEGEYLKMAQKALGVGSNTVLYGWTTKENQTHTNVYELALDVTATPPVPVPAAVWLMGTGLAGLAALKRRNEN